MTRDSRVSNIVAHTDWEEFIGVSESTPQKDLKMLFKEADLAPYQAKEQGRSQIVISNVPQSE